MWGEESCANSPSFPAAFNSDAMRLLYREGWRGVRVSRARAKEMKSPVYASLHVFSKNFRAKLDFLLRNNYHFLSARDCNNRNRLVSVVFKLCKRIISPINMTSFYITTHDKIHEYYSVFWLRLESAQAPNYPFFRDMKELWYNFMEKGSRFYPHTYSNLLFNNNHWTIDMYDQRWQEAKTWEIMGAWRLFPNLCSTIFFLKIKNSISYSGQRF